MNYEEDIAKRDARIAELEARYRRDVYGLNNEGDPIGGDPAGGHANYNARLRTELDAIKAQEPVAAVKHGPLDSDGWPEFVRVETIGDFDLENLPSGMKLYAAPVSEAKAQGVVMDGSRLAGLLEQVRLDDDDAKPHGSGATYWNNAVIACQVAIRDALAAPVVSAEQQVVVMPPSPYMPGSQPTDFTDYELGEIHGRIAMWDEVKRLNAAPVVNQQLTTECERCGNSGRIDIGTVCDNWVDCPECAELERHL